MSITFKIQNLKSKILPAFLLICATSCGQVHNEHASISSTDQNCDNPDAPISCSFQDMPSNVDHILNIPTTNGVPMTITGKVYKADGKPWPNVLIYAYHTDEGGIYSKNGKEKGSHKWHGKHHGWVRTDEQGRYEIHSIRPGKYPNSHAPAHIHAAVKMPDGQTYWISDFVFKDDPDVSEDYRSNNPGGNGVVEMKLINGKWVGVRNITLK